MLFDILYFFFIKHSNENVFLCCLVLDFGFLSYVFNTQRYDHLENISFQHKTLHKYLILLKCSVIIIYVGLYIMYCLNFKVINLNVNSMFNLLILNSDSFTLKFMYKQNVYNFKYLNITIHLKLKKSNIFLIGVQVLQFRCYVPFVKK